MVNFDPIKPALRPRIGLYSIGLRAYWAQFPGLRERLIGYSQAIAQRLAAWGDVVDFGLVDDAASGRAAGEWFQARNVDIVFCHSATYCTSACVLPVHQICKAPLVILNLQPATRIDYARTTTGEWLAHCGACPVPELCNAFNRAGVTHHVVNGLLGLDATPAASMADEVTGARPEARRAWAEIEGWARAAGVLRTLRHARFGFLGNTYGGMLDLYSDFTMIQAQTGLHVEVLEMGDLARLLREVSADDIAVKRAEVEARFRISGDSDTDPIARQPTDEQMQWACTVAAAQEKLVRAFELDALAYYVHGAAGDADEKLQAGFIVGHSLLTARGIPCAGEGDLKTAVAMKVSDILGVGGSFSEIVVVDYEGDSIVLGHDGPFHVAIADGKPVLRGMGLFHGKHGTGVSVEAQVRPGPVTTLNLTQTGDGKLKFISAEGQATDGPTLCIGNTQTPVKFRDPPDLHMDRWFAQAPTHHFALATGHQSSTFTKVAALLNLPHVRL
jgi:L-arabinose isomerase